MSFTPRSPATILKSLVAKVLARSPLNDLEEGSVLLHILASVAEEIGVAEVQLRKIRDTFLFKGCSGSLLDERASELPTGSVTRLQAGSASGSVMTIERQEDEGGGYATAQVMAAGATFRRSDDPSQTYRTIQDQTFGIGVGTLTEVWVVATTPGKAGNCKVGYINTVDSAEDWVISCSNAKPLTNGVDTETDQSLLVRVLAYLSSLAKSQPRALEYAALSYVGPDGNRVRYAHLTEDPIRPGYSEIVIDDGSGLAGTDRPGATCTGTVPHGGQYILYHEYPAVETIKRVVVTHTDASESVFGLETFTSLPEKGQVFFPAGVLTAGDVWEIGDQTGEGQQYRVFTGLIAALQTSLQGSTSTPAKKPGWSAAGTRVRVLPPTLQALSMSVHITPISGVTLSSIKTLVINDIIAFSQALAPGATLYVSQLVDYVMNNKNLLNVRFYRYGTTDPLEDTAPLSIYHAIRVDGSDIAVISAPEE